MKQAQINQYDRQEFLNWRMNGVGGSDVPMVIGISPYGNKNDLFRQKVKGENVEINPFIANKGHQVEKIARAFLELNYGMSFLPLCVYDEDKPHRMASLDGYNPIAKVIMECKYVGAKIFGEVNSQQDVKEKMEHYYCQVQWQLIVASESQYCFFVMVDSKNNKKAIQIRRDDEYIQRNALITLVDEFWKWVSDSRAGVTPKIEVKTPVYEDKKEVRKIDDENLEVMLENRAKLVSEIKDMQDKLKMIEENIKATDAFKEKSSFMCGKYSVALVERMGNVDYKKIEALRDVNLEEYRGQSSTYWKFS